MIGQIITYNRTTSDFEVDPDGTQHCELHHVTMSMGAHCISYVDVCKDAL